MDRVTAMLFDAKLGEELRAEAVRIAKYIKARSPIGNAVTQKMMFSILNAEQQSCKQHAQELQHYCCAALVCYS